MYDTYSTSHSLVVLDCRFEDLNGIYYTIDCYPPTGSTGSKGYGLRIEDDADLVLYLNLDEGSGNIAHDLSGNDNHGTIHGVETLICSFLYHSVSFYTF